MLYNKLIMKFISIFLVIFISIPTFSFAIDTGFIWDGDGITSSVNSSTTEENSNSLNLESGSAILIEQNTGKILYEHNAHEKLRPASVTKVMTILLIMEALDSGRISLDDKVPCSENATKMGGSQIWLDTRESLTVHDMLKAICIVSANDCTVAMAEFLSGSTEAFVTRNEC